MELDSPMKKLKARKLLNMTDDLVSIYDDLGNIKTLEPVDYPALYLANESAVEPEIVYIVDGKFISEAKQIGRSTKNFVTARGMGLGPDDIPMFRLFDLNGVQVEILLHESSISRY